MHGAYRPGIPGFKLNVSHYMSVLSEFEMKNALLNYGAVTVVTVFSHAVWDQPDSKDPAKGIACAPASQPNHAVTIVGFKPCEVGALAYSTNSIVPAATGARSQPTACMHVSAGSCQAYTDIIVPYPPLPGRFTCPLLAPTPPPTSPSNAGWSKTPTTPRSVTADSSTSSWTYSTTAASSL